MSLSLRRVLNVGGGSKSIAIRNCYQGWDHVLLDIDPMGNPDIVCDARELGTLPGGQFDAVYCSHNLEHYFAHATDSVLRGFVHVLKPDGFADIQVPDLQAVMEHLVTNRMDIQEVLYTSPAGPITAHDVIYGLGAEIERSGNDFYAHKTGFTGSSLTNVLERAGFLRIFIGKSEFTIGALAFLREPDAFQRKLFDLPPTDA